MVKNKCAFTLIELIISLVVISLLSGITLAYYNKLNASKKLEQETNKLIDVLELAKNKALTNDLGNQNASECNLKGYAVEFSGDRNYFLVQQCATQNFFLSNYSLTDSVRFLSPPANILFSPLTGSNNGSATITLIESSLGVAKVATVSVNYGNIQKL
jgi:prepilin-type N-terminal cleavage/methylation domain-containing protein